jgi:segregation and condensation protein B
MPPTNLRSAVEALLFSSDQPLTLALLAEALESPAEEISAALQSLGEDYVAREAGVTLREMAGGWLFTTAPEQHEWVARMLRGKRKTRLSRAALETMAIIAYKQPVTKGEIEAIRGVDASGVLATLLERNLVTIKGRSTVVGRPLLYGTTPEFLNYFGLRDLAELPRPEELRALVAAREPEQLEMMELDPGTGMPLALIEAGTAGDATLMEVAAEGDAAAAAHVFSVADADAAIAQANAARAEAAMAIAGEDAPGQSALAGASDLAEAADDGEGEGDAYDDDEFEDDDDDDEFDDAYDDDDEDEDDEDEEEGEDARSPLSLEDRGGH